MSALAQNVALSLMYMGVMPDFLTRAGIRSLLANMVHEQDSRSFADRLLFVLDYVRDLKKRGLAEHTKAANEQHYEVPAAFYEHVMGRFRKYSCGLWPEGVTTLDASEEAALTLVCERAQLSELPAGARVLDMGCGWGSFSLFASARYPKLSFVGVSNSASQREFIMGEARARGLKNINILTADINVFDARADGAAAFDRVVSIEMMEHVKNYELLLSRVSSWLAPRGKMFVHIFTSKHTPFHYTDGWMAERFFSGGQMPSASLLCYFQTHLRLEEQWVVSGVEYAKTCNAWLEKMDAHKGEVLKILGDVYGAKNAYTHYVDWRVFFLSCAELFDYDNGSEWFVSHYRFEKRDKPLPVEA